MPRTEAGLQSIVGEIAALLERHRVPDDTFREVVRSLGDSDQRLLRQTIAYPEESVRQLMTRDVAAVRDTQTSGNAVADVRHRGTLPPHSDRLFVVDSRNILRGSVGLQALLVADPEATIATVMEPDQVSFSPEDGATQAARQRVDMDLSVGGLAEAVSVTAEVVLMSTGTALWTTPTSAGLPPSTLIEDAHDAGLMVHTWTFRNETRYLSRDYGDNPVEESLQFYCLGIVASLRTSLTRPSARATC